MWTPKLERNRHWLLTILFEFATTAILPYGFARWCTIGSTNLTQELGVMAWVSTGCSLKTLQEKGRLHTQIGRRFVSVIYHRAEIFCIDSPCHHAGGPLGDGSVADIEGIPCIKCPWHNFLFALDSGERVVQELRVPDSLPQGTFIPPSQMQFPLREWPPDSLGPAKRTGSKAQRVHLVRVSDAGDVQVLVDESSGAFLSDKPAVDAKRGKICMSIGELRLLDTMPSSSLKISGHFGAPTRDVDTAATSPSDSDQSPPASRGATPAPD